MAEPIFYRCNKCGNLVMVLNEGACVPQCCGQPMERLTVNTTDAATEKHVPVASMDEDGHHVLVSVGEVEHPMTPEHYIEWIAVVKGDRTMVAHLHPGDKPQAKFGKCMAKGGTAYAYCNLHGLWKADISLD